MSLTDKIVQCYEIARLNQKLQQIETSINFTVSTVNAQTYAIGLRNASLTVGEGNSVIKIGELDASIDGVTDFVTHLNAAVAAVFRLHRETNEHKIKTLLTDQGPQSDPNFYTDSEFEEDAGEPPEPPQEELVQAEQTYTPQPITQAAQPVTASEQPPTVRPQTVRQPSPVTVADAFVRRHSAFRPVDRVYDIER